VRIGAASIVTDPEHVAEDVALLRNAGIQPVAHRRDVPIVWHNGSAAVLLHEAHGHPLEHGLAPLVLPEWLRVEVPLHPRRATFRDVPLLRMQHVHVSQVDAPFAIPDERIDVQLVDSGAYEPLTDIITIRVAASSIGAFDIVQPRAALSFLGADGEPRRYPGVICSREGQELVVGSAAPTIVTVFR